MASPRRSLLLAGLVAAAALAVALTVLHQTSEPVRGLPPPQAPLPADGAEPLSAAPNAAADDPANDDAADPDPADPDPTDPDRRSAVDVAAECPPTVIHGRLVHKQGGAPVVGCKVFVILVESSFSMPRQEISQETWTDADGRFRLELALDPAIEWRGSVHAYSPDTEAFTFPVLFEDPRTLDMGDQRLAPRSENTPSHRGATEDLLRTLFDATRRRQLPPSSFGRLPSSR